MSAEDRLRDILRDEASTVVPAGDGLARIQERVARKRRLRLFLVPGTALATTGAVAAFLVLGSPGDTQKLIQDPATHAPSPTVSTTQAPGPSPTPSRAPGESSSGPALWPFTSSQEAAAWQADHSARPWAADPLAVGTRYLESVLKQPGLQLTGSGDQETQLLLAKGVHGYVATLRLIRVGAVASGTRPWTVTEVVAAGMTFASPAAGDAIASPTTVSGTLDQGVDESVRLQLLTSSGTEIALTSAPAGSTVPWSGSLSWTDQSWTTGGVVASTYSPKDGALTRLAVVPVKRGAASGPSFAGLKGGHVGLFDASTGTQVRQLTYPPAGRVDTGLAWNGSTLVWVRSQQTGCADELDRLAAGTTTTLVPKGTVHLGTPRLSPDGRTVAYLSTPCDGGAASVVVLPPGAPSYSHAAPADTQVADVRDDGTVLASVGTATYVVPATTAGVATGTKLTTSCGLQGPAFDGAVPVAWEVCKGYDAALVRFSETGARVSVGPKQNVFAVLTTSFRDGTLLAAVMAYDNTAVEVRTYAGGAFTHTAVSDGSVREPSW